MDAVFETLNVKVDEESDAAVGELEVAAELGLVEREDNFDYLVFDDDGFIDENVHFEGIVEGDAIINDGLALLPDDFETCFGELVAEACFIDAFDQPWAEVTVNNHRTTDDLSGEIVFKGCGFGEH